jgi:hypothetical protein
MRAKRVAEQRTPVSIAKPPPDRPSAATHARPPEDERLMPGSRSERRPEPAMRPDDQHLAASPSAPFGQSRRAVRIDAAELRP